MLFNKTFYLIKSLVYYLDLKLKLFLYVSKNMTEPTISPAEGNWHSKSRMNGQSIEQ